ncbi:malate synthase A [Usitatibacter palustris]|uniref:Malate synthase n=1 Tax=Usitatibacter palustris TaxID=2732487 RepID=A0A6M4H3S1_9PROT|nr:malate synthase A [Usitatibacter palustris]QJR13728.1 Malate synthase A [Usitatibacter palustris]
MKRDNFAVPGIQVPREMPHLYDRILTREAVDFVAHLARQFERRRRELMKARSQRQARLDAGERYDFLPETSGVRSSAWQVAGAPADLRDRRVEITGPVERKMIINALNSGASTFMADFEDSSTPSWDNMVRGQINLRDAVDRSISFTSLEGKHYALGEKTATLIVRPRGWHMLERHVLIDGEPISASLFDFGLYFFHNAEALVASGSGPYFYLPKIESHLEARLWNDVFVEAQAIMGLPRGTVRATVLIETLPAAFEMDEILYELREHSAGLNCGRWDYIFSCIKKLARGADFVLADRSQVTMTSAFLRSYCQLLVKTCHRREAHAMGGMAAQIPIKSDAAANEAAIAKVRADKEREATDGFDGTWVAHPGLVPVAKAVFDQHMPQDNQVARKRDDVSVKATDLLAFGPEAPITEAGLRTNINVALQYLASWLAGNGCVPINDLMEDAATAEISRSQIWQWIRSPRGVLVDGRKVTAELFRALLPEELRKARDSGGATWRFDEAARLLDRLVTDDDFVEFLTEPAYEYVASYTGARH